MNVPDLDAAILHAETAYPCEAGGLWLRRHDGTVEFRPARTSKLKDHWAIPPQDWLSAERDGEIVAFFHSHPDWPPVPSPGDRTAIDAWGKPWCILSLPSKEWAWALPEKTARPALIGREFVSGDTDCYGIIRDYYARLGITLMNPPREWLWWLDGKNLYLDNCVEAGFYEVPKNDLRPHDMVLLAYDSPSGVPNHGAVYLGDNQLLQHFFGKPSARSPYGQFYRSLTTHVMRHRDL